MTLRKAYKVYQADIVSGYATFTERTRKHPFMFCWFIVLFITAIWLMATIIDFSLRQPAIMLVTFDLKWAFFGLYFIFFTLGALGTHFRMMRNTDLTLILSSPVSHRSIMFGKFLTTFWLNMGTYTLGMCSMLAVIEAFSLLHFIGLQIFTETVLLAMLGTCAGFLISILGSVRPFVRKAFFLWLGSFYLTVLWFGLELPFYPLCAFLTFLLLLVSCETFISSTFFLDGWNAQTTVRTDFSKGEARYFIRLLRHLPAGRITKAVAVKEFLFNARTRENLGSALTIICIAAAEITAVTTLGPRKDLKMENAYLIYPIVNAMAIYVGAILFCAVEGMTLLGKEAKGIWVVKSMPAHGADIMGGKTLSALVISLFLVAIAIPIPYIVYHNIYIVFFSIIGSLTLIFTYLGIGIWVGATSPNFISSFRGTPDIVTLYSIMMLCLVVGAILLFPPLIIMRSSLIMGILASTVSAFIGLIILITGVQMAGKAYDRLEINL